MEIVDRLALRREDETWRVKRIAPEHATDRIRDELLDKVEREELVALLGARLRIGERLVALEGYAFEGHVTIDDITNAIRFRDDFIIANLALALCLTLRIQLCAQVHEMQREVRMVIVRIKQHACLEIPRSLITIPICFGDISKCFRVLIRVIIKLVYW